jgi:release factor glutamine methyltransferase
MTLIEARRAGLARLAAAGITDGAGDVAVLLAHVLDVPRAELALMSPQTALRPDQAAAWDAALAARAARRPVSHIIGRRLFWGRDFSVTPDVLDPRPETEALIAAALTHDFATVLDLGTGSGCILLTLLAERAGARGLGVDLSSPALAVARGNADRLGIVADFAQGNWFAPVTARYDLIVSNPPYIAADEMAGLSPEVRRWEPHLALTPGGDGLAAYRSIAAQAGAHLSPAGWLIVEIGPTQGAAVAGFFAGAGLENIEIRPDLDGRDRVVLGQSRRPG